MAKESVTIVADEELHATIRNTYSKYIVPNSGEYISFCAKTKDLVITGYTSKKQGEYKVCFVGEGALSIAKEYDESASVNIAKQRAVSGWVDLNTQLGSDEVGTGDFFGPVIVVASLVSKQDIQELREIGIDDSKKLTDKFIKETIPGLLKKYRFVKIECDPEKYNAMIEKGANLNKIKAVLHNQVLQFLSTKYKGNYPTYIDQFCPESTYFDYLQKVKEVKKDIIFHTKGESLYPSIALASCIARYYFLTRMDEYREKYGLAFPFGASNKVDEFAEKFTARFGIATLKQVCKQNFKNYTEIVKKIG